MPHESPDPRPNQSPPLSARQIRFCQFYLEKPRNGVRAFYAAGFEAASDTAAGVRVLRLLRNVKIREYMHELRTQAADTAMVTVNRLVQGLSWVAFADRTAIFAEDGTVLPPGDWPPEVRAIVASYEVEQETEWRPDQAGTGERKGFVVRRIKVKFERSMEAKKVLAQYLKMIGKDTTADSERASKPLVVGGEADVGSL